MGYEAGTKPLKDIVSQTNEAMRLAFDNRDNAAYSKLYQDFIGALNLPVVITHASAGHNGKTYTLDSAVNGASLGGRAITPLRDKDEILGNANAAHIVLSKLDIEDRVELLKSFEMGDMKDAIALSITANMGKCFADAKGEMGKGGAWVKFATSPEAVDYIENYQTTVLKTGFHVRGASGEAIENPEQLKGTILMSKYPDEVPQDVLDSIPEGILKGNGGGLSMPPSNYPFALGVGDVMLATLAGNATITKVHPQTTDPMAIFSKAFNEHTANWLAENKGDFTPKEIAAVRTGATQIVNYMPEENSLELEKHTNNTRLVGSMPAGNAINENRSNSDLSDADKARLILELAGDNPMFIGKDLSEDQLEDASVNYLKRVASNAGQICVGIKRAMVDKKVYLNFAAKTKDKFANYTKKWSESIGNPHDPDTKQGALMTESGYDRMQTFLRGARDIVGDENVTGGRRVLEKSGGVYVTPALIVCPEDKKDEYNAFHVKSGEIFAPVTTLMSVEDVEEAVDLTNMSTNNLSCSIWSNDAEEIATFIEYTDLGSYNINNPKHGSDNSPYGEHMGKYPSIDKNGPTGGLAQIAHHFNVVPNNPEYGICIDGSEDLKIEIMKELGVNFERETNLGPDFALDLS